MHTNMKKISLSILAIAALLATSACEDRLNIPQKGVTAIENYYNTEEDAVGAMVAAYSQFSDYVMGIGYRSRYVPYRTITNNLADDMLAAGSNFGDNDFEAALNEFRADSGCETYIDFYKGAYHSLYTTNLVIDNFKNGAKVDGNTPTVKRIVAEARVLRAFHFFLLAQLWGNPPFVDHVLPGDANPYNCDKDPDNPISHDQLMEWIIKECVESVPDLDERKDVSDKDGAVKVTKGFAWALAGKTAVFMGNYTDAKKYLRQVIDSHKYALVPGEQFTDQFHRSGDGSPEKIFEANVNYYPGLKSSNVSKRSGWQECQLWSWRTDHFAAPPHYVYTGGADGWGGLGVPQWFGDEFFANDGHSYRFDATLISVSDAIYGMQYKDESINAMSLEEKMTSKKVGIKDIQDGLYGQSTWLPLKLLMKAEDTDKNIGNRYRLNNKIVMRYAEVLLLYAEACIQSGSDLDAALDCINEIQNRAGSKTISSAATMDVLKKEKEYELWMESCRWFDLRRWGDFDRVAKAGSDVPKLFDKLFREPKSTDKNIVWENGTEANSRFYTTSNQPAVDAGYVCGFKKGKHEWMPYPLDIMQKNPNMVQNPGWE